MPYKIFYTDKFIPARFAGMTIGPFIFIRPSYAHDEGLLAHEKVHVSQFWHNPFFGLAYQFSKKKRLQYESEAYREQLLFYQEDMTNTFARHLATKYSLDITEEEAKKHLKRYT